MRTGRPKLDVSLLTSVLNPLTYAYLLADSDHVWRDRLIEASIIVLYRVRWVGHNLIQDSKYNNWPVISTQAAHMGKFNNATSSSSIAGWQTSAPCWGLLRAFTF